MDTRCQHCNVYEVKTAGDMCPKCYGMGFRRGMTPEEMQIIRTANQITFKYDLIEFDRQLAESDTEGEGT